MTGSNVTLTPDATNDKVTIGITKDNVISALGYTPGSSVDNNTTYTLSKSGSTITLTGSDGSKTSVTDTDTNTHYTSKNVVGSSTATSNTTSALTNGNVYLNSVENGAVTSTHKISGSGATKVTTDTSGNIVISSTDNNTDTKVTQTVTTSNASYPLLLAPSGQTTTATTTSYFDSGVTLNPSTNTIAANVSGTATALTTSAGSKTQPVYFSSGKPVACTYTLGKSVPSDAVFTDTVTTVTNDITTNSDTIAASTSAVYALNSKLVRVRIETKTFTSTGSGDWHTYVFDFSKAFTIAPLISILPTTLFSVENICLLDYDVYGVRFAIYEPTPSFTYGARVFAIGY